jgi:hypothetical protein
LLRLTVLTGLKTFNSIYTKIPEFYKTRELCITPYLPINQI